MSKWQNCSLDELEGQQGLEVGESHEVPKPTKLSSDPILRVYLQRWREMSRKITKNPQAKIWFPKFFWKFGLNEHVAARLEFVVKFVDKQTSRVLGEGFVH